MLAAVVVWVAFHLGLALVSVGAGCLMAALPYLYTVWSFRRMIPRVVSLTPLPEDRACWKARAFVEKLEGSGFRLVVGPLRYNSRPPSQLNLLLHATEPVYAAVLRVRVLGLRKVHYSFLSPFGDLLEHLESTATPELEAVPAPQFARIQVIPGAEPDELLAQHLAALRRIRDEGREFHAPSAHELQREAVFTLAMTGTYLRRNCFRLANAVFAYAWNRVSRNPPLAAR